MENKLGAENQGMSISPYVFLGWSFIPLAAIGSVGFWFNATLDIDILDIDRFRDIVDSAVDLRPDGSELLSTNAFLSLVQSSQVAQAMNYLLLTCGIAVVLLSGTTLKRNLKNKQISFALVFAALIASLSLFIHLSQSNSLLNQWYFNWWSEYLDGHLKSWTWITNTMVFSANISVALLVVAASSFLSQQVRNIFRASSEGKRCTSELMKKIELLRILLYAAAIQLSIGVLGIYFGLSVNLAPLKPELLEHFAGVVSSMAFYYGVGYTIFLIAAFLPSYLILSFDFRSTSFGKDTDAPQTEMRRANNFEFFMFGEIKQFSVVLGPLLAGVATSAFDLILS